MSLALENVRFSFRRHAPVLDGVSAEFVPGRLTAILGPNGAGKTTMLRIALGVLLPSAGRATLDGTPVANFSEPLRAARLGYAPQRAALAAPFSVAQFVRLGRFAVRPDEAAVQRAMVDADIADRAAERFENLSAGQQQRATLARVLAQLDGAGPPGATRAILADEPFAAMDPRHMLASMSILQARARAGLAVVVAMHDLTMAARFADRVLLLDDAGRVAADGPTAATLTADNLRRVFAVPFRRLADAGVTAWVPESPVPSASI